MATHQAIHLATKLLDQLIGTEELLMVTKKKWSYGDPAPKSWGELARIINDAAAPRKRPTSRKKSKDKK